MGLREMLQKLRDSAARCSTATTWAVSTRTSRSSCAKSSTRSARGSSSGSTMRSPRVTAVARRSSRTLPERREQLDQLPPDLAGRVQELQQYDWMDDAARQRFEELMEQLKEQLLQSTFNQMSEGMQNMDPERMARMKDMLHELNQMLDQRANGEEPDFDGFMEKYGDFFPGNPQNLDELLEQMAQSMAQMQQMLNSMTPEQRAQLQALSESLLEDMDLRWQVDQLAQPPAGVPEPSVGGSAAVPRRRPALHGPDAGAPRAARRHGRSRAPAAPGDPAG